ncbi:CaiB/BaiF CoA-transferase family protein [Acrocarpospora macrocephala]|uniref:CoA transferase n=1 Tax=Acrocarpospora macrocephala TaxID=150177 RepID=A0A5M3X210_9ACTN|nr:CoA transferase [Acrocarpospora macrocephala]GES12348.1 CoA transferase [Acrocarpospora macrocephala]
MTTDDAPLAGIKVLDLSRLMPGPYASRLLVDLGADALKIEEPTRGDYLRESGPRINNTDVGYLFALLNHGKRSMTLNLKTARGVDLLDQLCAGADVLLESFRPGVMARLGLGADRLLARHPHLIYCAINGYGSTGPYANLPGHDHNYLAVTGAASLMGDQPRLIPLPIADLESGQRAVVAILAAIIARSASGKGRAIEISMLDGAVSWMIQAFADYWGGGIEPARSTDLQPRGLSRFLGPAPGYSFYQSADGGWIAVAASEDKFWRSLCAVLGRPDLADADLPPADQDQAIREAFRTRNRDEWIADLLREQIAAAPVNTMSGAMADPQIQARDILYTTSHPELGDFHAIGNVLGLGPRRPAELRIPRLGADTDAELRTLHLTESEIAELRAERVV